MQIKRALFYETRRFLVHNNNSAAPIQEETAAAKALKLMILISLPFFPEESYNIQCAAIFYCTCFLRVKHRMQKWYITTFRKCTWSCCSTLILFFNSYYKDTEFSTKRGLLFLIFTTFSKRIPTPTQCISTFDLLSFSTTLLKCIFAD